MYPVSTFNYHRDDHVKALFLMANGKKVTAENRGWVMVAVANTGAFDGIDKKCLEDRMQWVDDNHLMIMEVARTTKVHLIIGLPQTSRSNIWLLVRPMLT